jgi:hypothetical protein
MLDVISGHGDEQVVGPARVADMIPLSRMRQAVY